MAVSINARSMDVATPARPSIEDLAARGGIRSEQVVLSSDDALEPERTRNHKIHRHFVLRNRVRAMQTEFILFIDGHLDVLERRRGKPMRKRTLNLRFLDPTPLRSRYVARATRRVALALTALGALAITLAYFSIWLSLTIPVALSALAASTAAWIVFVRRTHERIGFRTAHGRAVVLTLLANLGAIGTLRKTVPRIVNAIRDTQRRDSTDRRKLLREEMREHYRLAAEGFLSEDVCGGATRRILERFD